MPCYDERSSPEYAVEAARLDFRHNSDVAEMLCGLLRSMSHPQRIVHVPNVPGLARWWQQHQERDRIKAKRAENAEHNRKIDQQIEALRKQKK